ncbi:MAG TPA: hypothetical protein VI142_03665 [Gaiellaceae bacterium]
MVVAACVVAAVGATVFMGVAKANGPGAVDISCTSATYTYTTFPSGTQSMHETVWVDGVLAAEKIFDFTGPSGTDTLSFSMPNDGAPHEIVANSYWITNDSTIYGMPGIVTLTCAPPPPAVCTYTKGFYRNHADVTASLIAGLGGSVPVGSTNLTAAQAQAVLNATPGQAGNLTFTSNLLLNLVQQLITAELNVARGSSASSGVQSAITSATSAVTVKLSGGRIQLSSSLSNGAATTLETAIENFNSASDCGTL